MIPSSEESEIESEDEEIEFPEDGVEDDEKEDVGPAAAAEFTALFQQKKFSKSNPNLAALFKSLSRDEDDAGRCVIVKQVAPENLGTGRPEIVYEDGLLQRVGSRVRRRTVDPRERRRRSTRRLGC